MGAQHSSGRLSRLSHGGNVTRAPKPSSGPKTLNQGNDRSAQFLLPRNRADSLRLQGQYYRNEPVNAAPLTPLPLPLLDDDLVPSDLMPTPSLASPTLASIPGSFVTSPHDLAAFQMLQEDGSPISAALGGVTEADDHEETEMDDLPLDLLCRVLAHVPRSSWPAARAACTLWRDAVGTPEVLWQRFSVGLGDPWAILVEWVFGNSRKDHKGVLWAFDPASDRMYRLGWVPELDGVNHSSQMVAFGPYAIFLGGTISRTKPDGTMDIIPGPAAWGYHLQTGRTRRMPDMIEGRVHFASAVINGKLIVAGGTGEAEKPLASVEEYDPKLGQWTKLPDLSVPRGKCFGGELNGSLVVFSQNPADDSKERFADVFDPATQSWSLDRRLSPANFSGKTAKRFALVGNKVVMTSDLGPNSGCGNLEAQRSNLSLGHQISWCTSIM